MSTATTDYEHAQSDDLLDVAIRLGMDNDDAGEFSPVTFAPRVKPPAEQPAQEVPLPPRSRVLSRLLAMADTYLRTDSLRQALEMYFDLARNHPDAPEALLAEERILEVARRHEEAGELHSARAIYEQLA